MATGICVGQFVEKIGTAPAAVIYCEMRPTDRLKRLAIYPVIDANQERYWHCTGREKHLRVIFHAHGVIS